MFRLIFVVVVDHRKMKKKWVKIINVMVHVIVFLLLWNDWLIDWFVRFFFLFDFWFINGFTVGFLIYIHLLDVSDCDFLYFFFFLVHLLITDYVCDRGFWKNFCSHPISPIDTTFIFFFIYSFIITLDNILYIQVSCKIVNFPNFFFVSFYLLGN